MKQFSHLYSLLIKTLLMGACLSVPVAQSRAFAPDDGPGKRAAPKATAIGDLIFQDYNRNGIQDTGEPGIASIPVQLYQQGVLRGQTTTDTSGRYTFDDANVTNGLQPATAYEVRVATTNFPTGFTLTRRNQGTDPETDSDARLIGGQAVVSLTTTIGETINNSYDIGLAAGGPDVTVVVGATSTTVAQGATTTFTLQASNVGDAPAEGVVVRDTLDPGLVYVSSSPAATTSSVGAAGTLVTWNLGTLANGAPSTTLTVTATAQTPGLLFSSAGISTTSTTEVNLRNNANRNSISVPILLCQGEAYEAVLPAAYTNVQWYRDGTAISTANSLTITQAGSYSYTATTNLDCPVNSCSPIVVQDAVVPLLTLTPANPVVCRGLGTSLTVDGCGAGALIWSTGETTATISVTPTSATSSQVYSVTCVSSTYGICTSTASTTVTINENPVIALTTTAVCTGELATVTATAGAGLTYAFSPNLSPTGQPNVAITTVAAVNGEVYSVTATNEFGCTSVASTTAIVNPRPELTLSTTAVCAGELVTVTATPGLASYTFSAGLTQDATQANVATTAAAPANGDVFSVTAANGFGCTSVASVTTIVNPRPTLALSTTAVCAGELVTVTATPGLTSYTFSAGLSPTGLPNVAITTAAPVNGDVFSVTAANGFGCTSVASTTAIVNPRPTLALSTTAVCAGELVTVTATPGLASYTFSAGLIQDATQLNVATTTAAPTNGDVFSVTAANGFGCTSVASTTAIVNERPTLALSTTAVCAGELVTVTATPGLSYTFSAGLVQDATLANVATTTVAPADGDVFSVTAANGFGCTSVASVTAIVNPRPTLALSTTAVCDGQLVTVTATPGLTSYTFSAGLSPTGQPNVAITTVAPADGDVFSVTAANGFGCTSVASVTVIVNELPTLTLSTTAVCAGELVSVTATPGLTSYTFSAGLTQDATLPNVATTTVAPINGAVFSVTAANANGCTSVASVTAIVNPLPLVSVTPTSATVCEGETVTLTADGATTYVWSTNATGPVISVTATGVYSVTGTNDLGCSNVASATITVNPTPDLTVNAPTICAGQSTTLTLAGCEGGTIVWSTGDNTALLTVVPLATTTYSATCTLATSCSSIISTTVTVSPTPTFDEAPTVTAATCSGTAVSSNAQISLTTLQNTARAELFNGSGTSLGSVAVSSLTNGSATFTGLANPTSTQTYTVRLFGTGDTCPIDVPVVVIPTDCSCGVPKCVPVVIQRVR